MTYLQVVYTALVVLYLAIALLLIRVHRQQTRDRQAAERVVEASKR